MRAELFLIPDCPSGRLAIMPRPRAGDWLEDEIASWKQQGLDVVVSVLEDDEIAELELMEEQTTCERSGLRFIRFPIPDRDIPTSEREVSELIADLVSELQIGRGVGIHCRIGVGRSALIAVCILVRLGIPIESAWNAIEKARGLSVPDTPTQRDWVAKWHSRSK